MDKIKIRGGQKLNGSIEASGAKNAALPILISSMLTSEPCQYTRVPDLQDISTLLLLLSTMGVKVEKQGGGRYRLCAESILSQEAPYDLVRKMRASVIVLGPLLARFGRAKVSLPGGCAIGARPIGYHLSALKKLGAKIELEGGYVIAEAKKLRGARIGFEFPSVGATENTLMAAVLAEGESVLENCAMEPEIVDLALALRSMGAKIEGEGTATIRVQGQRELHSARHEIMADRIEAGTYLAAGFATRGKVRVNGIMASTLESVLIQFEKAGARIQRGVDFIELEAMDRPRATDITTLPFPGFPTDMQAQYMALMCVAVGASVVTETIFENRFMHVSELARLGADITIRGNTALVRGPGELIGAPVMATDLRASASLVIAGLCASGETEVNRIYHLDRGYEAMVTKLINLGADIERTS